MQLKKTILKKVWIVLNKKCFIFLIYKKLEKRQAVEFLIKKKISSLIMIAACSFLYVRFLFVGDVVSGVSSMYNVIMQYLNSFLSCSVRNLTLASLSLLFTIKIDVFPLFTRFNSHCGLVPWQ